MAARNPYQGVFIVGAGQTTYEKRSDKPIFRVLWEALDAGLRSACLPFRSVEGLALTSFVLPPDNVTTVAEHFGIADAARAEVRERVHPRPIRQGGQQPRAFALEFALIDTARI